MTIVELIAQYRDRSKDNALPYFLSDDEALALFNEAEVEACTRRPLLIYSADTEVDIVEVTKLVYGQMPEDICTIDYEANVAVYPIHEAIVMIYSARLANGGPITVITDRRELDRKYPGWREDTGEPRYMVVDEVTVQLVPKPITEGTVKMDCQCLPIFEMTAPVEGRTPDSPSIAGQHHRKLYHWVMDVAHSDPDSDQFSDYLSSKHQGEFDRYFGPPVDSDRKRATVTNTPHRNKIW